MTTPTSFPAYLVSSSPAGVTAAFITMADDQLDPGDVTVRVQYASVNFKDALAATGKGKIIRRFPCVGGIDASGVVESSSVPHFKPGDSVIVHSHGFGVSHHGGYAGRARAPAAWVNRLPPGMSALEAITLGVAGYTAALGIDLMELNGLAPAKGKVLVNGATGGVASVSIDLLAQRGYQVVAVTGKPAEADYLRLLGASEVIASADLPAGTKPLEPALWQGAVDSLGGAPLAALTRSMQTRGRHRQHRQRRRPGLQRQRHALHPARRAPDRRQLGQRAAAARPHLEAPGHRPAPAPPGPDRPCRSRSRSCRRRSRRSPAARRAAAR